MNKIELPTDRIIDATDNNEYAEGLRDEGLSEEEMMNTEIPLSEDIIDDFDESGEGERPLYNEEGYRDESGR